MNEKIKWLLKQVKFFVLYLVLTSFADKFWGWFEGDSLIKNALGVTIGMAIFEIGGVLLKNYLIKKIRTVRTGFIYMKKELLFRKQPL